jgi:Tfp pilus assembly protein PilX
MDRFLHSSRKEVTMFSKYCTDTRGIVLITAIGLIVIMSLVGSIAGHMATTNTRIGGNDTIAKRSFYAAEAGTEEGRARLRETAGVNRIDDTAPTSTGWEVFIGDADKAQTLAGYDANNADHTLVASLQNSMDYVVAISHKTDGAGNVLYWGDPDSDGLNTENTTSGQNIYIVTGYGAEGKAVREIGIEAHRVQGPTIPGPVYVEKPATIMGNSTNIIGEDPDNPGYDSCGGPAVPGVVTTLPEATADGDPNVEQNGSPTIAGDPDIQYNSTDLDIQGIVNQFKSYADFSYTVSSTTLTGTATPGPGDDWGTPTLGSTLQDPSTCDEFNIVYFDTQDTYVKLSGGVTGCGLLLVDGDLMVNGGFNWYGAILVTGAIVYSGGGQKQVTGAVLSEESADVDVSIGGNTNIVYCNMNDFAAGVRPLLAKNWKEELD